MPLSNRTCFMVNLRAGLCCQQCGLKPHAEANYHRGFEYHHVQWQSLGGSDEPDNIVLLCRHCHEQSHRQANILPQLDRAIPARFLCYHCDQSVDPQQVEMNCGWYRCPSCQWQVSLFQHFFGLR